MKCKVTKGGNGEAVFEDMGICMGIWRVPLFFLRNMEMMAFESCWDATF